jgi:GTP-binding protein
VLLIANKIDDPAQESLALDLHRLGLGDPRPVSALHGSGDLLDEIVEQLPGAGRQETPDDAIRVAILGRPNVGKSSLLNAILGHDRVIVSETPGTTRDSIDTVFERGDRTFVFVDTAGIRRKRRHRQGIEYYSELRAREAAERADIALILVDIRRSRRPRSHRCRHRAEGAGLDDRRALQVGCDTLGIEDIRPELSGG